MSAIDAHLASTSDTTLLDVVGSVTKVATAAPSPEPSACVNGRAMPRHASNDQSPFHRIDITEHSEGHLPEVIVPESLNRLPVLRRQVLNAKQCYEDQRAVAAREARGLHNGQEKNQLYKEIRSCVDEERVLEAHLQGDFVPQHGLKQFLSPRSFLQTQLFGASNRAIARKQQVEIVLAESKERPLITYRGPELRQSDARVFLSILHMLRDVQVGTLVYFDPTPVCKALYGGYDGHTRSQLREHVRRLQTGLILTDNHSIQLCQAFEHPKHGLWSVALHRNIVELFKLSPRVWLSMPLRLRLPDGLPSWLYAYAESQTRLIPTELKTLLDLCGSRSKIRAFSNSLRNALKLLAENNIIEPGWSIKGGYVRWMKKTAKVNQPEQ